MTLIAILFTLSGVMLAALGVPMLLGRVPPNSLYGFRTPATIGEPALWYPENSIAIAPFPLTDIIYLVYSK